MNEFILLKFIKFIHEKYTDLTHVVVDTPHFFEKFVIKSFGLTISIHCIARIYQHFKKFPRTAAQTFLKKTFIVHRNLIRYL